MRTLFIFLALLVMGLYSQPGYAQESTKVLENEVPRIGNETYRKALIDMSSTDQELRKKVLEKYTPEQLQKDKGEARQLAIEIYKLQISAQNKLISLINEFGFPDSSKVGVDGARAAFLIAQHSPNKEFQKNFLKDAESAVQKGLFSKADWAYLVDRTRVLGGMPQLYGTQHKPDGTLFDIEDPDQLQQRRLAVGLQ